jgi:hypothetical protein
MKNKCKVCHQLKLDLRRTIKNISEQSKHAFNTHNLWYGKACRDILAHIAKLETHVKKTPRKTKKKL